MNWLRRFLHKWLRINETIAFANQPVAVNVSSEKPDSIRININKAINGHVLILETYKPNRHGPDWTSETMVVPQGDDLMDAIKTLIAIKSVSE